MSWFKTQSTLSRSPKIRRLARLLGVDRQKAVGIAIDWFSWLDTHSTTGRTDLFPEDVDDELEREGAALALVAIGWVELDSDGCVCAVDFDAHNGATAKARATEAKKKANQRGTKKGQKKEPCLNSIPMVSGLGEGLRPESVPMLSGQKRDNIGELEKEKEYKKSVVGSDTVVLSDAEISDGSGAEASPPVCFVTGWSYEEFCTKVGGAHPATASMRLMPKDAVEAAKAAFRAWAVDDEDVEMLTAFYQADLSDLPRGTKFYRPAGLKAFYENLGDVKNHARNWAKWKDWKPKGARQMEEEQELKPVEPQEQTEEEKAEMLDFWEEQKASLGIPCLEQPEKKGGGS